MYTENKIARTRKPLYLIILMTIFLFIFSTSGLTSANAQEDIPETPTEEPTQEINTPEPPNEPLDGTEEPTEDVSNQIVGGQPADPGEWPWQVRIVPVGCGGSLVTSEWVVTAAHCVTDSNGVPDPLASVDVIAGIYNLATGVGYQYRDVSQIIIHPNYNPATSNADIALLRLSSPVSIGGSGETKTGLIPLVPANVGDLVGINATVTGWGALSQGGGSPSILREVQVPIINNSLCNDANHYNGAITSNMLCAGFEEGGKDSCQGDSGGPLVIQSGGKWKLAGVVSWGYGCAQPKYYGVYTRVSRYTNWILSHTGDSTRYEPNNSSGQAKVIASGTTQSHSIIPTTDSDWMKFTLSSPSAILLETTGTTSSDTRMWLYDNAISEIEFDDDDGSGNYSLIDRICDIDSLPAGTYYVKVDEFNNDNEISAYNVSLGVQSCVPIIQTTIKSQTVNDGWILESTETSGVGGTKNYTATTFNLGDDASDRQYRTILSFNTANLPDTAVITTVTFKVKRESVVGGGNPVSFLQGFMTDIKNGSFGTSALALADYKTNATTTLGPFTPTISSGWYTIDLTPGMNQINKTGLTQIRLRFQLDDNNNNVANYLKLYSGDASNATRPQLIIEYYVP